MKKIFPFLLLLYSCDHIKTGRVIGKHVYPGHIQDVNIYQDNCECYINTPIFFPEEWTVTVRGFAKGELTTENISVSHSLYDSIQNGWIYASNTFTNGKR